MVIQRWQSVFLLLGAILSAAICFVPWAVVEDQTVTLSSNPIALTLNLVVTVLFLRAIFMYRNMPRQKTTTLIGLFLLMINNFSTICLTYIGDPAGTLVWYGGVVLFVMALICGSIAYNRISADQRLLRSADRLR